MATGDPNDMTARLSAVMPAGWFQQDDSVLNGILTGIGTGWAWCYSNLAAIRAQGRLATAFGWGLDLFAADFFGPMLQRNPGEVDNAYRNRISAALQPSGVSRAAILAKVRALGCTATAFEPSNPTDTGGWDTGYFGWDTTVGGWGDPLIAQAFITVTLPTGGGVANYAGWADVSGNPQYAAGGWDSGNFGWTDDSMITNQVTASEIYQTIAAAKAEGVTVWVGITNFFTDFPAVPGS
jgi:hypothetical protein